MHLHRSRMHISQRQTFDLLRQKYWVLGNFSYVKTVVRNCKTPRCRYVKFGSPKMSPLPALRIDNPKPWTNVGVDYMGPLNCKHECMSDSSVNCVHPKIGKVWLVLFTCFHTRAIHVELVETCSTRDFLDAFRRFIGHCGRPNVFYSDNARYFVAAKKSVQQIQEIVNFKRIQSDCFHGDVPIEWKFSTPEAPWTNGVTERMVGIFKRQLKIALQKELLTTRAMETLIIELKGIINDRPFGVTKENPEEWTNVTSNLLIFGRQLNELNTPKVTELAATSYSDMWLERKRVLNLFWTRWLKEYIQDLSVAKKWSQDKATTLKEGDVVILKPETLEKNVWKLARITKVQKNLDDVVTIVTVRLPNGNEIQRSVRQIALLESDCDNTEKVNPESSQQSGCAGSLGGMQTVPDSIGQLGLVFQPPHRSRPCHGTELDDSETDPGNVTAMVTEPVSRESENDTLVTDDAKTSHNHNLRKKRQRRGFYRDMLRKN